MEALLGIGSAFGLSTSAGLNAYIPMLMVSILGRVGWLDLGEPFNIMESWWVIGLLSVLLVIEIFVDKIPAVDTLNDVINTFIRPAAGALLFAAGDQQHRLALRSAPALFARRRQRGHRLDALRRS